MLPIRPEALRRWPVGSTTTKTAALKRVKRATATVGDQTVGQQIELVFPNVPGDFSGTNVFRVFELVPIQPLSPTHNRRGRSVMARSKTIPPGGHFRFWDGEGGDNRWSTAANWALQRADGTVVNSNIVPGAQHGIVLGEDVVIGEDFAGETITLTEEQLISIVSGRLKAPPPWSSLSSVAWRLPHLHAWRD